MKRGFTIIEVLCVICIIAIVSAITFPVFVQVRRSAHKTVCINNLRSMGTAIALYRNDHNGADQGTPSEMGLPTNYSSVMNPQMRCRGSHPFNKVPGYAFEWPAGEPTVEELATWTYIVEKAGTGLILVSDENHQPSPGPKSLQWESWTVLGLRLDTSVIVRTRLGYPSTMGWWLKP